MCVLDLSKAFDKVGHRRSVEKLRVYDIDGEANIWIGNYLRDHSQGASSGCVPVISDVAAD